MFDPYFDLPGADEKRLLSVIERIREFVRDNAERYTPDVIREVAAVEAYIERGFEQFDRLLKRHAEFDAWLAERSVS